MTLNRALHKLQLQMGSSLICRKRKANEIDDEYDMDKVLGTVIDAEKWYFVECTLDEERKPSFKLSEPVIVEYNDENMQIKVKKVLRHIVWLRSFSKWGGIEGNKKGKIIE
ncbi:hypothetical protein RirG_178950 [Rhizophagus irregularis DAOM 197198w]|uniref:Uncharacterized protein n=1 Tax=Rhizophagus irregularis (strain DAOM 197198w) TaxID=1432141 RepID=A0A015M102_RHIIW|nr:hypothetical protein RirG_178950 [Rhizophagus irregularis DAOM 197198w]